MDSHDFSPDVRRAIDTIASGYPLDQSIEVALQADQPSL
ncbi:MAG: hypothetical protein ACI8Y4_002968 [Candidatus Poriferisodalaceae bacterium]|jgi:hypothetical protein